MRRLTAMVLTGLIACAPLAAGAADPTNWGVGADIELDTDVISQDETNFAQGGRVKASVFGEHKNGDYFVRGKGEALIKKDGTVGTDDAFVQFGASTWDLQAGRFEAWDLGPVAKDTVLDNVLGTHYRLNTTRGRAGADVGQIAFHLTPSSNFAFELATLYGEAASPVDEEVLSSVRGAVRFGFGMATLTAGVESTQNAAETVDSIGFGATAALKLGEAVVNLNLASLDDDATEYTGTTLGANVVYGPFGAGLLYTMSEVDALDVEGVETTLYTAYTVSLFDIDNASVTFGLSHSVAGDDYEDTVEDKTVFRTRVNYTFF